MNEKAVMMQQEGDMEALLLPFCKDFYRCRSGIQANVIFRGCKLDEISLFPVSGHAP